MAYQKVFRCLGIARFSIAISITCLNNVAHCSHAWIHIEGSSRLVTIITSHWMEVDSLKSQLNNRKYSEKDVNEACQLNLYPMANHHNYKSQSWMWPFWRPYFRNLHFTIYTIHSANPLASRWSHELIRWSMNAFSHKSLKFPWNFVRWLMRISIRTPNLLNNLSKNVGQNALWTLIKQLRHCCELAMAPIPTIWKIVRS